MVDFHGWEMPLQYSGILEEHTAVRTRAGLFDLSHMGRVRVGGPARRAFLQRILTINLDKVAPGRCKYTFFLTERGTVIDDLVFYAGPEEDLLVVNASNREKDLDWLRRHAPPEGVAIRDETFDVALLAVQGPRAVEVVRQGLGIDPSRLRYYSFGAFGELLVSRTGYTGEDGFEIFLPKDRAVEAWERLIRADAPPAGLGARDTLRTEAGMPLYGNELDETTTPLEAGLDFAVDLKKPDFIGAAALRAQAPPPRRLAGLILDSRRIPRTGHEVFRDGHPVGRVTSGTFGPTVGRPIAMAYLPAELASRPGEAVEIDIRGRREPARITTLPFYRREKT